MTYLITGGCGFVGTNLALGLKNKKIVIIDNFSKKKSLLNYLFLKKNKNITFYKKNISNKKFIFDIVKKYKPHTIFHLAGQVAMTKSIIDPINDFFDNTVGTLYFLLAFEIHSKDCCIPTPVNESTLLRLAFL
jgi:CDP-paratose 2-epimerase